jgi:hypothetical protein
VTVVYRWEGREGAYRQGAGSAKALADGMMVRSRGQE